MKIFRSLLIALAMLSLIACGDDGGSLNGEDLVDSGVEDDAAVKPPPGDGDEDDDDDDEGGGDPGDGDPGDGDPGDDDDDDGEGPGDGDPGDGDDDDGEGPGDDEPVLLSVRVLNQQLQPLAGATVHVRGFDNIPASSDENGEVVVEVPAPALYLVRIEPPDGDWAVASLFEAGGEESASLSVVLPDDPIEETYGDQIGFELSDDKGVVVFVFTAVMPGGQSAILPEGQPYVQLAPVPPNEAGVLAPGATLVSGGGNVVLYAEVPPQEIAPIYSSPNEDENCRSVGEPYGGWLAIERTLVLLDVTCSL